MQDIEHMLGLEPSEDARTNCFKQVFLRDDTGRRAFEYLLLELKFLEPCETDADMALNNKAKDFLALVYGDRITSGGFMSWFGKWIKRRKD